ncbi:hypothetical protein ACH5RR_018010 [Cinchona calisaya]|uniref:Uncharacterized protein n=1 Tax=Cinchona calisaya TaxID=153742 RepID=A0ABD2ZK80_9GENT
MRYLETHHTTTFVTRKSQVKAHLVVIALGIDPRKEIKETVHETWIWLSSIKKHSFEFDDHEQRANLVDDILEEMEVSVTGPSKFDVFSNVVHTFSNANITKNLDDGGNDVVNSQDMIQMENTIMTWRTPPIQTTLLKQPLKTVKPPTLTIAINCIRISLGRSYLKLSTRVCIHVMEES